MSRNEKHDQIMFLASPAFKEALATYAQSHSLSIAHVVRTATAALIGYDLSSEPRPTRASRYPTRDARRLAANERQALRRAIRADIIKALQANDPQRAAQLAAELPYPASSGTGPTEPPVLPSTIEREQSKRDSGLRDAP